MAVNRRSEGHKGSHGPYCTILELSFHLKHTAIAIKEPIRSSMLDAPYPCCMHRGASYKNRDVRTYRASTSLVTAGCGLHAYLTRMKPLAYVDLGVYIYDS
ncbi:Uncharacterized protein HZ326_10623 [Fusarium oxysporum f. sp. albedinis]|nr:Uncharacterized protein HZ326_10623 [Fusarium oxysporum f. sp. albedinis]